MPDKCGNVTEELRIYKSLLTLKQGSRSEKVPKIHCQYFFDLLGSHTALITKEDQHVKNGQN